MSGCTPFVGRGGQDVEAEWMRWMREMRTVLDGSCLLSGPSGGRLAVLCASGAVGQGRESIGVEMKWNGDELMKMNWVYDGGGFVFFVEM